MSEGGGEAARVAEREVEADERAAIAEPPGELGAQPFRERRAVRQLSLSMVSAPLSHPASAHQTLSAPAFGTLLALQSIAT
jgi:hypothetical protein